MLVSMKAVLELAKAKKMAVGAFNITDLEGIQAVLESAEELHQPVIIQFAPVHEPLMPLSTIGPVMVLMAEKSSVPVCVHLDHCDDFAIMQEALKMGFTSIMYDGSILPFNENVANTKIAVELAGKYSASVEAELGAMDSEEGQALTNRFTEPDQAKKFVELTHIDALACSFGTVHGLYSAEPNLDFERIEKIRQAIDMPIVMHGGSGVSDSDLKKSIANGVCKINYYTYRQKAGGEAVRDKCRETEGNIFFYDIANWAREAMKQDVLHAMKVFANLD